MSSSSSDSDELIKLRFKCKQQATTVEQLEAQLKKLHAELTDTQTQYEDSLSQVSRPPMHTIHAHCSLLFCLAVAGQPDMCVPSRLSV